MNAPADHAATHAARQHEMPALDTARSSAPASALIRLRDEHASDIARHTQVFDAFIAELRDSSIAIETQAANAQHYELPTSFFAVYLGPRLKYSYGYYPRGDETLAQAEDAMFALYAERAQLADGQRVLDLGCGWGSLALSNSHAQCVFIETRAQEHGLGNVLVVTGNIVDFDFHDGEIAFDRILSIEMFEHVKNYGVLLAKIARWIAEDGKLFVHLFAHKTLAYHFTAHDGTDWMSRYFFTGGTPCRRRRSC